MITAAIVLYHTNDSILNKVIESYKPNKNKKLYLIDNSEERRSVSFNKELNIEYIFVGKNIGYGAGHNIGIHRAIQDESEYHIVLNPDLEFDNNVIDKLKTYADMHKDVVYILPKVIYPNGKLQYLCKLLPTPMDLIFRRFLPNRGFFKEMNDRYILKNSGYNKIMNPPCLSGCFMFMRTSALQKNNLNFDERFFMYCEDFDLMRRLHRIGKTIYYPEVSIIHNHARESYSNKKMLFEHIKSACKYFNKYGWVFDKERKKMNDEILKEVFDKDE